jgi:hypothetical protein
MYTGESTVKLQPIQTAATAILWDAKCTKDLFAQYCTHSLNEFVQCGIIQSQLTLIIRILEKEGIETAHYFWQHLLFSQGGVSAALIFAVVKEDFPSRFLPSLSLSEGLQHVALGH